MYIAVDVGGTKTLIAVFDENGEIKEQVKFPTPWDYNEFIEALATNASTLETQEYRHGVVGMRGNVNRDSGYFEMDSLLKWVNVPIRDLCCKIFNCRFRLENDSKLAGLYEAGQLKGQYSKVLYITISTGFGTSLIVDNKISVDVKDSELGKTMHEHEGKIQKFEDFASGSAIVAKYGKKASEIDDPEIWKSISKNFSLGFINASACFCPDVILVGGGVGTHFEKYEIPLNEWIRQLSPKEIAVRPIFRAKHPEEAVIYGAYELAKNLSESNKSD